jgi:hypothetical protein
MNLNNLLKSRRFWATLAAIAVVYFKDKIPGVNEEQITGIVLAIGSWVIGESLRSTNNVEA